MGISDELYKLFRPTYYLSKAFGLAPFQLRPKSKMSSYIHKALCLIYHMFLIYLVANSMSDIVLSFYYNDKIPKFERLVLFLQIVSVFATNIVSWYKLLFHNTTVIEILVRISDISITFELMGCQIPYTKLIRCQRLIILFVLVYATLNFSQNLFLGENAPGIFIMVVGNATMICQFLNSLILLRRYFEAINHKLSKYGNFRKDGFQGYNTTYKRNMFFIIIENNPCFQPIKQITEIHRQLCQISSDLNQFFSLPILLSISHNIMNLTSICYYVSAFIIDPPKKFDIYLDVSLSTVLSIGIMSFIQLCVMAYVCSATAKVSSFTAVLVHGLLNSKEHYKLKNDLRMFSQQILHQRLTFTAARFFVLDFTLINAVIGAVTTYLVILIQFQIST